MTLYQICKLVKLSHVQHVDQLLLLHLIETYIYKNETPSIILITVQQMTIKIYVLYILHFISGILFLINNIVDIATN